MYSYKLLETPGECAAGCGTTVLTRLAGHYYREPMCDLCFSQAAPEIGRAIRTLEAIISIQALQARPAASCANCGDILTNPIAGHHYGDPLCVFCFAEHAPLLGALLLLDEAAIEAADKGRDAQGLLVVATNYSRLRRQTADYTSALAKAAKTRAAHID